MAAEFDFDIVLLALIVLLAVSVACELAFRKKGKGEAKKEGAKNSAPAANSSPLLWLVLVAIIGRIALKTVWFLPSVEPVIPLAVFGALVAGPVYGAIIGVLGYFGSNLFIPYGLYELWWFWQSLAGAVAGAIAGFAVQRRKPSSNDLLLFTFAGTVCFELIVSIGGGLQINPAYWFSSLPFITVHIVSNLVFAALLSGFLKGALEGKS